ncbi:Protein NHR-76 [Aphelenchoides avenae]|nr:Protein NHR-76 [Aphelenchus avenae]
MFFNADINLVDYGLKRYAVLRERRRLIYCPRNLRALFSGEHPTPKSLDVLSDQVTRVKDMSADFALIVEYIQSLEPFRVLSVDDKVIVARAYMKIFYFLEQFYITYLNGGHKTDCLHRTDYTYFRLVPPWPGMDDEQWNDLNKQLKSNDDADASTSQGSPAKENGHAEQKSIILDYSFGSMIFEGYRNSLRAVSEQMENMQMTDLEFVGMSLVLVFDSKREGLSEIAQKVLASARSQLFTDWVSVYRRNGVQNGEERMGSAILLLTSLLEEVRKHDPDFHMFRLFGMLEYDKLLDELFM